ncbi:exonuclease V isoform X3 [Stegostoma tigrinum]|uniref:exonuclease V isoform X3 n=1 Tax=Stegostoma tigrinum TaxID=3053191 RepID=UPI00202ADDDA|nr:exonuclease V isoform X3 [Stegostoma tigrinum]
MDNHRPEGVGGMVDADGQTCRKSSGTMQPELSDAELLALELDLFCGECDKPELNEGDDGHTSSRSAESCCTGQGTVEDTCSRNEQSSNQSEQKSEMPPEGSSTKRRKQDERIPLERFGRKYLNVTDLTRQVWCEQQVVYGLELPHIEQLREEVPVVKAELEIQDIVPINVESREDSWAVKILNLLSMIQFLQAGERVRELPVFGELEGIFLVGVVDELCYNSKGELELCELKTRGQRTYPSAAQRKSHLFQVNIYKLLFEAMIKGKLNKETITDHLRLRTEQPFSSEILMHAQKVGFSINTFGDLLDLMLLNLTYAEIPNIDTMKIEYCYQADASLIGTEVVYFEEEWVKSELKHYCSFWKGQREAKGVDIEEAWKCRSCDFADICEWRHSKAEEATQKNRANKSK